MINTTWRDRSNCTREELLAEIDFAERLLDGLDADNNEMTLWWRIASLKPRLANTVSYEETEDEC